jgi:KaiC/GvpD/RAD55 family RecA-like ATPase
MIAQHPPDGAVTPASNDRTEGHCVDDTQNRRGRDRRRAEIIRAAQLLLEPGGITELRALHARLRGEHRTGTVSGYFDSAAKLADAVGQIVSAKGIYIVPNTMNPALLARAANRVRFAEKGDPLTADHDMVRRRWLFVDFDPVRPAGIGSTDDEHAAARARAELVRDDLRSAGWPDPVLADSGNGWHLLYRIDLPAADGRIVERVLLALAARFSDDAVKVDTTVHNAARIWKLYGTTACKGDATADRPHRVSRLVDVPEPIVPVAEPLLLNLAVPTPADGATAQLPDAGASRRGFDLVEWIRRHLPDASGPAPWNGGEIWTLPVCPFNSDHTGSCAFVGRLAHGAIIAGCHHNSCQHWSWQELRAKLDPQSDSRTGGGPTRDSIQPPTRSGDRIEYRLVSIADLGPAEEPDWYWPGYVARGAVTLLTGLWKAGKTTLLIHLLRDLYVGGGLVDVPIDQPTLIVSEEPSRLWSERRETLGLSPSILFLQREAFSRPDHREWRLLIEQVSREVKVRGIGLVIFDTLPSAWPVVHENDAGETLEALTPLRGLCAAGAGVLLVCHPRKGDGAEATATRGSGALPGFVDIIVELRRHTAEEDADRRRVLRAWGRYEVPAERVIELEAQGYRILGDRAAVRDLDMDATIARLLPTNGIGIAAEAMCDGWPTTPKPGLTRLRGTLNQGFKDGKWMRDGRGVRKDPHLFRALPGSNSIQSPDLVGERIETEGDSGGGDGAGV